MSNTCVRYSQRALAPIVSFVTLLFNNVLWLGSWARSHAGKGIKTRDALFFIPHSVFVVFFSSVFCSGNFSWVSCSIPHVITFSLAEFPSHPVSFLPDYLITIFCLLLCISSNASTVFWLTVIGVSPDVLTSFSASMRRAVSSSLSQLWLFKQTTLHRMMDYRAHGYEGKGTSFNYTGQRSRVTASPWLFCCSSITKLSSLFLSFLRSFLLRSKKPLNSLIDFEGPLHNLFLSLRLSLLLSNFEGKSIL